MIAPKRKPVFVTPFSSQKMTNEDKERNQAKTPKRTAQSLTRMTNISAGATKTPAGAFFFPVSSSRMDKIQHVTPMTKNMIKQGLSQVIAACPEGADPNSPSWTFLAVSQATSVGGLSPEKSKTDQHYRDTEDNPLTPCKSESANKSEHDETCEHQMHIDQSAHS